MFHNRSFDRNITHTSASDHLNEHNTPLQKFWTNPIHNASLQMFWSNTTNTRFWFRWFDHLQMIWTLSRWWIPDLLDTEIPDAHFQIFWTQNFQIFWTHNFQIFWTLNSRSSRHTFPDLLDAEFQIFWTTESDLSL